MDQSKFVRVSVCVGWCIAFVPGRRKDDLGYARVIVDVSATSVFYFTFGYSSEGPVKDGFLE